MNKNEKLNKILSIIAATMMIVTVLAWGLVMMKYGRWELYTVHHQDLYINLEWGNYRICQWIVPLH